MKALVITTLLALAAPQAAAGGFSFDFGFGYHKKGKSVRVNVGKRHNHKHKYRRVWVPGHYDTVSRRVWVPGCTTRVWKRAQYGTAYDRCGNPYRYVVRPAGWFTVRTAGHWDVRYDKVWHPGRYEKRRGHRRHR